MSEGRYDLVILDTPPSRHALDFLEAPRRLSRLIEGRAIQAFLPKADSLVTRAASKVIQKILGAVFGEEFASELIAFMSLFSGIFTALNMDVNEMRTFLSGPNVAFLLVTSPAPETLVEANFFHEKTKELDLPFKGFVLNRSRARSGDRRMPDEGIFGGHATSEAKGALLKLQELARVEQDAAARHLRLLGELEGRAGKGATAIAIPELPQGADDMATLITVADVLAAS